MLPVRFPLILGLLACLPWAAWAAGGTAVYMPAPPSQQQEGQSVEEPDAPDEMQDADRPPEQPVNPLPPVAATPAPQVPSPTQPSGQQPPAIPAKPPGIPAGEAGDTHFDRVLLQGLNKVTARAETIEAPLGSVVRFGTIEIVAHSCWRAAPEERPENAALLDIFEIKQGEAPRQVFLGWMFSSTPGLSALEHPFYDVSVIRCEKGAEEKSALKEAPPAAPKKATPKKR